MTEEELAEITEVVTELFQKNINTLLEEEEREKATNLWIHQKTVINMIVYAATAQQILKSFGSLLSQSR